MIGTVETSVGQIAGSKDFTLEQEIKKDGAGNRGKLIARIVPI